MVSLPEGLAALRPTCQIAGQIEQFPPPGLYVHFSGNEMPRVADALATALSDLRLGRVNGAEAFQLTGLPKRRYAGLDALVAAMIASEAKEVEAEIDVLEQSLTELVDPDGPVSFALSLTDSGTIFFTDLNSLVGVALLALAYAKAGRYDDARDLAGSAYEVVGAEGLLALELVLLQNLERWDEMLRAAEATRNPKDPGRFEIELLRGRALEGLERRKEAMAVYARIADPTDSDDDHVDSWLIEAQRRRDRLAEAGEPVPDCSPVDDPIFREDGEEFASGQCPWYDPLQPVDPKPDAHSAPSPPSMPMPEASGPSGGTAWPALGGFLAGQVKIEVMRPARTVHGAQTWLDLLDENPVEAVLTRLDAAIAAPPRLVGLRRRPDFGELASKPWQRLLAALLATAAGSPGDVERLAAALSDPEARPFMANVSGWLDAMTIAHIGEAVFFCWGTPDCLVLPLLARLHGRGETTTAREWAAWARYGHPSDLLFLAELALAFEAGDDTSVLAATSQPRAKDGSAVLALTYRARSLWRTGRLEPALEVFNHAHTRAARLGEDQSDNLMAVRYLRARALLDTGRISQALRDLHAIQALEHDYLDIEDVLAGLSIAPKRTRQVIPREVKEAVFRRDGGRCVECGSDFDIQYDHDIPFSLGGSSTVENLQLLCATCNRRKGKTLG